DGTGTALRYPATELGPGEAEEVAQYPEEGHVGGRGDFALGAINGKFHGFLTPLRANHEHGKEPANAKEVEVEARCLLIGLCRTLLGELGDPRIETAPPAAGLCASGHNPGLN